MAKGNVMKGHTMNTESYRSHMTKNKLFSKKQFGFISGRSTTLQLLKVMNEWTEILDNGGSIDSVYMDFMKAFDKVPHKKLIKKWRAMA